MSEPTVTTSVYAIDGGTPPQTWSSLYTYTGSQPLSSSAQPPSGYTVVDEETYRDALRAQGDSHEHAVKVAEYQRRVDLSSQRQQLVNSGMTVDQARILVPDPLGDYSIDAWV